MSTEFFNDQWRIPSNENQNKISNYSMSFDGTNDYIDAGTGLGNSLGTYTGDASISLWFKADTTASNDGLFSITAFDDVVFGNLRININSNILLFVSSGTASYKYISFTDTTSWHHLVCVFKSGDITNSKIYLDGVDQTTTDVGTFPSSLSLTGLKTIIGAYHSINQVFQGKIDQVTVFDYALSQDQVTQLGAEGYAFNFNGSTQAIDCGAGSKFNIDQITISNWVKFDSVSPTLQIISGIRNTSNGIIPYMLSANNDSGTKFRFLINQSSDSTYKIIYSNGNIVVDTWYHVVGVADGSNVKMYVNGVLQTDQTTYDGTITSPTQNFNIGRQPSNPLYYLDGELSNISVFNTGLTGPQVTTLYNSGKPLADMSSFTSLQGWWKLDETATFNSGTSAWSIPDASSNSNTGTSVGMDASNLVASNINGELIANPMITSPKPIAYYQLGDQSVSTGPTSDYLVPNNSLSDYVFDFDGSSSRIEVQDASNEFGFSNNRFSLSAWVFIDSNTTQNGLIAKRNLGTAAANKMWYFEINTSSQLRFLWYNTVGGSGNASSTDTVPLNTWTHVVVTSDGTGANGLNFYINESVDSGGSKTGPSSASSIQQTGTPLWVGARGGNSSAQYTSGKISNASIFNTALTGSQVETLYNNGAPNDISSLSPVGWWKLNASEIFNSKWSVDNNAYPSVYQSSLNFNGSSNYIDCGDSDDLSFGNGSTDSPFSISAWIYMDDATTFRIVSKAGTNGNEYFLSNGGDDKLNFILYDTFGSGNIRAKYDTALTSYEGQWIHIVGTYSGVNRQNGIELYLNGSLLTTLKVLNSPYTAMSNTTQPLEIGRSASSSYANGTFSNVSVFNIELSSPQVATLYNNGTPETSISHSPVSWWKLDNTTTGLIDNGSASNNGTNNGATEYAGFVNSLAGESSGMDSSNLVVSDLQQTSGYSPYALDFDGINDYLDCGDSNTFSFGNGSTDSPFSISAWVNMTDATQFRIANKFDSTSNGEYIFTVAGNDTLLFQLYDDSQNAYIGKKSNTALTSYQGQWIHLVGTYDGTSSLSGIKLYLNSSKVDDTNNNSGTYVAMENTTEPFLIGRQKSHSGSVSYSNGKISNAAIFNTELSSTQVTEIYNEGRPSDLHNFSGTAPVSWWQLGSNSSFNTNWTCLDEIGTNNAVSVNMTNNDIVDGVGYSASGLGTSSIDIKGDAPYSTANGLSENMDVLDRTLDTPIRNTHSIQLDGVDDYVTMGNVLDTSSTGASAFSMSCWFKISASGSINLLISKAENSGQLDGYQFWVNSNGEIRFFLGRYTGNAASSPWIYVKTTTTWNDGNWHNAVLTYNGNQNTSGLTLYVDGNPEPLTTVFNNTPSINSTDSEFMIGARGKSGDVGGFFEGKVDEVAMFNSELSALQVDSIYNNGNPNNILPLNPVSWHRFESLTTNVGVVTTADSSGNGLTGTVENGASLSTVVP